MNKLGLVIHCDGLCEPRNPGGLGCWAWVAAEGDTEVAQDCGCVGDGPGMTNNVAEYHAVGRALRWAAENGKTGLLLRTDSKLVVHQVNGQWQCNTEHLRRLRDRVRDLAEKINARLEWVPREQNERADALSRVAYRQARKQAT